MAKTKKVSIRSIEEAVEDKAQSTIIVDFNGVEITVKRMLSFYDMMRFVRDVVGGCFADDTGRYMPEVFPFMIRLCVLAYYTNVNIPQNVEKQYEFAYATGLYEAVIEHINQTQFNDIANAIYTGINHTANMNISEIHTKFTSIQETLAEFVEQLGGIFSGIDSADIENVLKAVGDHGIDEEKLMRAYIDNKSESKS